MTFTVDTNVLVRLVMKDDARQAAAALAALRKATVIAVPVVALCEMVWVLRRVYQIPDDRIAAVMENLLEIEGVVTDRRSVETGLALLRSGADFADGIVAFEGAALGGETFLSFDKVAVKKLQALGRDVRLLKA